MSLLAGSMNVSGSVVVVLLGMIVGKLLTFVWRGMLSGEMTAIGFSDFVAFFICINIASQIAFTPVSELIAKEASFKHQSSAAFGHFLRLYGAASIPAIVIGVGMLLGFSILYGRAELHGLLSWVVLLLPLAGLLMFLVALLRAAGDHLSRALFLLIGIHLFFALFLMLTGERTLAGAVRWFFFSYLLAALLCGMYFLRRRPALPEGDIETYSADFSSQVKFMVPMFAVQALDATSSWVDSIVLGAFLYEAMGAYSNVSFLAKAVLMANGALYFVIVPVFARLLHAEDEERLKSEYRRRTHHLALLVTPPALFLLAYARELLALIFSVKDPAMGPALQILVIGYLAATLHGPILALTLAKGETGKILISTLIFITLNVALSLLLAPFFGAIGAAIAASVSYLISVFFLMGKFAGQFFALTRRAFSYVAALGVTSLAFVWLLATFGLDTIAEMALGGAVVAMLSLGAYLLFMADEREKMLIRRLCHYGA